MRALERSRRSCSLIWEWNTRAEEKLEGVSQKQLRRGMATSSSVCRDSLLSQASQLSLCPKIATYFSQLLSPKDFSTPPPGTPLPCPLHTCCPQPPRGATHLQAAGPRRMELLLKPGSAWEDLTQHPKMLGCYKPQPPRALV